MRKSNNITDYMANMKIMLGLRYCVIRQRIYYTEYGKSQNNFKWW